MKSNKLKTSYNYKSFIIIYQRNSRQDYEYKNNV